jgi:hypothetical protein
MPWHMHWMQGSDALADNCSKRCHVQEPAHGLQKFMLNKSC